MQIKRKLLFAFLAFVMAFAEIAAEVRDNALVLITCEDESIDGTYLNRRVILAEPL